MADLRSYIFLDSLQPQVASFFASVSQGFLPIAGQASLFVEISPGMEINFVTDVALKCTKVTPGMQIIERRYGMLEIHSESQPDVRAAGTAILNDATCDRPCEPACRRGRVEEEPVAICRLKRVAADHKGAVKGLMPKPAARKNGRKIALLGGGPASLTVARDLAQLLPASAAVERGLGGVVESVLDAPAPSQGRYAAALHAVGAPLLAAAIARTKGNQLRAAELLGMNRNTLRERMRALGMKPK